MNPDIIKFSLKKLSDDARDFVVGGLFDLPDPKTLPPDFNVPSTSFVKDQGFSDYCSAYASTAVSEDQELIELSPEFQFFCTKQIEGNSDFGADLRDAAKSFVKYGSLEKHLTNFNCYSSRQQILDPKSWTPDQIASAKKHLKASYIKVIGPYDAFDNVRCTMAYFKDDFRSVFTGIDWCREWLSSIGGIINAQGTVISGHAFKVKGWKTIGGIPYMKCQLSSGVSEGDGGYFYMTREIFNKTVPYGAFMFSNYTKDYLQYHTDNSVKVDTNVILKTLQVIINMVKDLLLNQQTQ